MAFITKMIAKDMPPVFFVEFESFQTLLTYVEVSLHFPLIQLDCCDTY